MDRTEEDERLFKLFSNYLSLSQFELARNLIPQLFSLAPFKLLRILRTLVLKTSPPSWLLSDSTPSPAHLAWLAFVEHNRLAAKELSEGSTSKVNPKGFVTHDLLLLKVLETRNLVVPSSAQIKVQVQLDDWENSTPFWSGSAKVHNFQMPVLFADSKLVFKVFAYEEEESNQVGECIVEIQDFCDSIDHDLWLSLSVPKEKVPQVIENRAMLTKDIDFGRLHVKLHWDQSSNLVDFFPNFTKERLSFELLLFDLLTLPKSAEIVVEIQKELQAFFIQSIEKPTTLPQNLYDALTVLLQRSPQTVRPLLSLIWTVSQQKTLLHLFVSEIVRLLQKDQLLKASELLSDLLEHNVCPESLIDVFFRYIYRDPTWPDLAANLSSPETVESDPFAEELLQASDAHVIEKKAILYGALCAKSVAVSLEVSQRESVFYKAFRVDPYALPVCFLFYGAELQKALQAPPKDAVVIVEAAKTQFWSEYFTFLRLQRKHCFEFPILSAISFLMSDDPQKWSQAQLALAPFPQLLPLFVLVAWDHPELRDDYEFLQQLVQRMWRERALLEEEPTKLSYWCNRLDLHLRLVEPLSIVASEKLELLRKLEHESIVSVFGETLLEMPSLEAEVDILQVDEASSHDLDLLNCFFAFKYMFQILQDQSVTSALIDKALDRLRSIRNRRAQVTALEKMYALLFLRNQNASLSLKKCIQTLVEGNLDQIPGESFVFPFQVISQCIQKMHHFVKESKVTSSLENRLQDDSARLVLLQFSKDSSFAKTLWLLCPLEQLKSELLRIGSLEQIEGSEGTCSAEAWLKIYKKCQKLLKKEISPSELEQAFLDLNISETERLEFAVDLLALLYSSPNASDYTSSTFSELCAFISTSDHPQGDIYRAYVEHLQSRPSPGEDTQLASRWMGFHAFDANVMESVEDWMSLRKHASFYETYTQMSSKRVISLEQLTQFALDNGKYLVAAVSSLRYLPKTSTSWTDLRRFLSISESSIKPLQSSPFRRWLQWRLERFRLVLSFSQYISFTVKPLELMSMETPQGDKEALLELISQLMQQKNTQKQFQWALAIADRDGIDSSHPVIQHLIQQLSEEEKDASSLLRYLLRLEDPVSVAEGVLRNLHLWESSIDSSKVLIRHVLAQNPSRDLAVTFQSLFDSLIVFEDLITEAPNAVPAVGGRGSWIDLHKRLEDVPYELISDLIDCGAPMAAKRVFRLWEGKGGDVSLMEKSWSKLKGIELSSLLSKKSTLRNRIFALKELEKVDIEMLEKVAQSLMGQIDDPDCRLLVSKLVQRRFIEEADGNVPWTLEKALVSTEILRFLPRGISERLAEENPQFATEPSKVIPFLLQIGETSQLELIFESNQVRTFAVLENTWEGQTGRRGAMDTTLSENPQKFPTVNTFDGELLKGARKLSGADGLKYMDINGCIKCLGLCSAQQIAQEYTEDLVNELSRKLFGGKRRLSPLVLHALTQLLEWAMKSSEPSQRIKEYSRIVISHNSTFSLVFRIQVPSCLEEICDDVQRIELIRKLVRNDQVDVARDVAKVAAILGRPDQLQIALALVQDEIESLRESCRELGRPFGIGIC